MELVEVTMRGQAIIPASVREQLGIKNGGKVVFMEENGRVIVENAAMIALKNAQQDFTGEAERLRLKDEADVVKMIKEIRRKAW